MRRLTLTLACVAALALAACQRTDGVTGPSTTATVTRGTGATFQTSPPYGETRTIRHGQQWTGTVPYNPCKSVPAWRDHGHTNSIELYDELTGNFGGWVCEGGMVEADQSTIAVLD